MSSQVDNVKKHAGHFWNSVEMYKKNSQFLARKSINFIESVKTSTYKKLYYFGSLIEPNNNLGEKWYEKSQVILADRETK